MEIIALFVYRIMQLMKLRFVQEIRFYIVFNQGYILYQGKLCYNKCSLLCNQNDRMICLIIYIICYFKFLLNSIGLTSQALK